MKERGRYGKYVGRERGIEHKQEEKRKKKAFVRFGHV